MISRSDERDEQARHRDDAEVRLNTFIVGTKICPSACPVRGRPPWESGGESGIDRYPDLLVAFGALAEPEAGATRRFAGCSDRPSGWGEGSATRGIGLEGASWARYPTVISWPHASQADYSFVDLGCVGQDLRARCDRQAHTGDSSHG